MKRSGIVLFITFTATAIFFIASAFSKDYLKEQTTYEYFQFTGNTYSELYFEDGTNWYSLGTTNPSANPCWSGTRETCVLRIDFSLLSADPGLSLPERLALYLENLPGIQGATTFVNDNYTYRKL